MTAVEIVQMTSIRYFLFFIHINSNTLIKHEWSLAAWLTPPPIPCLHLKPFRCTLGLCPALWETEAASTALYDSHAHLGIDPFLSTCHGG